MKAHVLKVVYDGAQEIVLIPITSISHITLRGKEAVVHLNNGENVLIDAVSRLLENFKCGEQL